MALPAAVAAGVAPSSRDDLARPFAYDARQPLDLKLTPLYERDGMKVFDLEYASPRQGRVPGYLVMPTAKGPFAGIVFGHWGPGNRTEFLPEAELYAEAGAVSVMIDYPWVRPAPWRVNQGRGLGEPEKDRASWEGSVIDLRRALDVLAARPEVDAQRIGYVGHSYGAQWGAILAAVDRRIKAAVLMAGVPDTETMLVRTNDPGMAALRAAYTPRDLERYLEINRPYDAVRYVPYAAPTPLFFQFAHHERGFGEADMRRYFDAASEPKLVRWYHTGHELNDVRALADRAAWIEARLHLKPTRPLLMRRLETDAGASASETDHPVIQLEKEWSAAFLRHDRAAVARIVADDFVGIDSRGVVSTKADELAEADASGSDFQVVGESLDDFMVRTYGDAAVLRSRNTLRALVKGQERSIVFRRTTVWVKRDGRWQCVSFHASRILETSSS